MTDTQTPADQGENPILSAIQSALSIDASSNDARKIQGLFRQIRETQAKIDRVGPTTQTYVPGWVAKIESLKEQIIEIWEYLGPRMSQKVASQGTEADRRAAQISSEARAEAWWDRTFVNPDGSPVNTDSLEQDLSSFFRYVMPDYEDFVVHGSGILYRTTHKTRPHEHWEEAYVESDGEYVPEGWFATKITTLHTWEPIAHDVAMERLINTVRGQDDDGIAYTTHLLIISSIPPGDAPVPAIIPVIKNWLAQMKNQEKLINHLQVTTKPIADYFLPMIQTGTDPSEPGDRPLAGVLDLRTGGFTEQSPDITTTTVGKPVIYDPRVLFEGNRDHWITTFVKHHFPNKDHQKAFWQEMGILMFGYGIANICLLQGGQGSGKDSLMLAISTALSGNTIAINPEAITEQGGETNDLARLGVARLAAVTFEGEKGRSRALSASALKSLASGGSTPQTVRAKYARQSSEIYYRGSLMMMSNFALNFGGGDPDGIDRRLVVVPIQNRMPDIDPLHHGFLDYTSMIKESVPYFTAMALNAYWSWIRSGRKGQANANLRIPQEWIDLKEEGYREADRLRMLKDFLSYTTDPAEATPTNIVIEAVLEIVNGLDLKLHRTSVISKLSSLLGHPIHADANGMLPIRFHLDALKRATILPTLTTTTVQAMLSGRELTIAERAAAYA